MSLKKLVAISLLLASPALAQAPKQAVQQSGNVTAGHIPWWISSGVVGDGGSSADSPITSLGVTNNGGNGICVSSARQTAAGRNQLCFGAATSGPATISLQNYGTAPTESIQFVVNGTPQGFPTVSTLPVTIGDLVCFNTTTGALKDCGTAPSLNPIVVGTTPIGGGTPNGLLYDNAGVAGNLATTINGVVVTNSFGVPSVSTSLPTGLALGTPISGVATNLTGTAAGLTAGTVTTNANLTGDVTSSGNAATLTNSAVIAEALTGFTSGAGTISSTDSILTGFNKADGNTKLRIINVKKQVFLASGTYTPSAGLVEAVTECVGSGGGGGGTATTAASNYAEGGGGGGGAYSRVTLSAASVGGSQIVTIGTVGAGGTAGNNAGGTGGSTTLGALCGAVGGVGGTGNSGSSLPIGGAGGSAASGTGDFKVSGQTGQSGVAAGSASGTGIAFIPSGAGGASGLSFGAGAAGLLVSTATTGNTGLPCGGGGSGAATYNATGTAAGGAGALGCVYVTEYVTQ